MFKKMSLFTFKRRVFLLWNLRYDYCSVGNKLFMLMWCWSCLATTHSVILEMNCRLLTGHIVIIIIIISIIVIIFRWKNRRRCKTGRLCTFAHGKEELESWKALRLNEQQASSIRSREDLPFPSSDISWNNVRVLMRLLYRSQLSFARRPEIADTSAGTHRLFHVTTTDRCCS